MFGYLYYWFACHYYKRLYKADHPVHFSAAIALGAIQFLLVYNAYMVYIMFFPLNMNVAYKTPVTVAVLAVVAVVCWFNYRFYGGKIEVLSKKYKSCALNNKFAGSNSKCKDSVNLDAKLKEPVFRGVEVEFFPWSPVDFVLDLLDGIVVNVLEVSTFLDVLSDEFVGVFYSPPFSRISKFGTPFSRISKFGSREHQHLQCGKKACAVGGKHLILPHETKRLLHVQPPALH